MQDVLKASEQASRRMYSVTPTRVDSAGNSSDDYRQTLAMKAIQCSNLGLGIAQTKFAIHNRRIDLIRGAKRGTRLITGVETYPVSNSSSPEEQYSAKERVELLKQALKSEEFSLLIAACITGNICEACFASFGEYKTSGYHKVKKVIQKARKILEQH